MIFYLLCLIAAASAIKDFPVHPMSAPLMPSNHERIIGGQEAAQGAYPWQVSLQRDGSHFCGGSIIGVNKIMSAAHCAVYDSGVSVVAGSVEWQNADAGQTAEAASFEQHPQYNANTLDYDFAVITLSLDLTFNSNVGAIQLADAGHEYPAGTPATMTGWGYVKRYPTGEVPDTLQEATVPIVSTVICQRYWGSQIEITDSMLCAAGDGVSVACSVDLDTKVLFINETQTIFGGDSGGPLVVQSPLNNEYRLIGVVSFGSNGCKTDAPNGFAKISVVRSWIDSVAGTA